MSVTLCKGLRDEALADALAEWMVQYIRWGARHFSDVDECSEATDGCLPDIEICRNTVGAYECDIRCNNGFEYNIEQDICIGKIEFIIYLNYTFTFTLSFAL